MKKLLMIAEVSVNDDQVMYMKPLSKVDANRFYSGNHTEEEKEYLRKFIFETIIQLSGMGITIDDDDLLHQSIERMTVTFP
jgi:hypothetical protein